MVQYTCFSCNKKTPEIAMQKRRVRCPYCGSKMLFKPRDVVTKVLAR